MNRKPIAILLTILLICGIIPLIKLPGIVKANPITIHVPTDYATITLAIAAANPGDTILVAAGTYNEEVIIDKALTIIGASADTTIIDGTGMSIPDNLVTITAAGDVTFDGFTLRNAPLLNDGTRISLRTQSSVAGPTYTISGNKFYGMNDPNEYDYGFYARGEENIVFTHNLVTEFGNNGILLEQHTGSTEISYNTLDAGVWGTDAIFFMTYGGVDVTTLQKVSYNTFDMGTGGPFDNDHRATGVSFCSTAPAIGNPPEAKFTNMVVSGNTFNNLQSYRRGIGFWIAGTGNDLVSPTITGNTITGVGKPAESSGIDFVGSGDVSGASIIGNTITGTAAGIVLRSGDASGAMIYYNNIAGNAMGLSWTGGSQADARYNWWGASDGPNPPGQGDPWTGNVDVSRYLHSQSAAQLYTDPYPAQKTYAVVGTNFDLSIKVGSIEDLFGFDIKVTWDNSLLTCVSLDKTPLNTVWPQGFYEPIGTQIGAGYARYAAVATGGSGFTGSTSLFKITLHIEKGSNIAQLQTAIHFEIAKLSNSLPTQIPATVEDGLYQISPNKPGLQFGLVNPYDAKPFERSRTFKVRVNVTDVSSQLTGYDIAIQYDKELFEFTRLEFNGTILGGSVQGIPGSGTVEAAASGGTPYVGKSGLLFTVVFSIVFNNNDPSHIWGTKTPHYLTSNFSFLGTQLTFVEGTLSNAGITIGPALPVTVHLIQGDINCDGQVDIRDLVAMAYHYDTSTPAKYDLNSDGTIDIFDLVLIASNYGYPTD